MLGVIKPILQVGTKIENYTKLYTGHSSIYLELKSIVEDIEVSRTIPPKVVEQYEAIRKRIAELGGHDDPKPDKNLIRRLQGQVNYEIPSASLWTP